MGFTTLLHEKCCKNVQGKCVKDVQEKCVEYLQRCPTVIGRALIT